jgi:hypothetical protein
MTDLAGQVSHGKSLVCLGASGVEFHVLLGVGDA